MFEGILIIPIILAAAVGFVTLMDFARARSLHYQLDEHGLSFLGALWGPKPIPYREIESVQVVSYLHWLFNRTNLTGFHNWSYATKTFPRKLVVLKRRNSSTFVLTPYDPEGFVRTISERILGTVPPELANVAPTTRKHGS